MKQSFEDFRQESGTPKSLARLREERVSTHGLPADAALDAWRELLSPVFDIGERIDTSASFKACARAYDLGGIHFVSMHHDGIRYARRQEQIGVSKMDHWVLTLRQSGSETVHMRDQVQQFGQGILDLKSLAMPFEAETTRTKAIMLFLKRDDYLSIAPALDASVHRTWNGCLTNIIIEFILSLNSFIETVTSADITAIGNSINSLLHAAIEPDRDNLTRAEIPIALALLEKAKRYIQANLSSPDLSPETVCKVLNVSRRRLYYLFESQGGIARYIRQKRLKACHNAIVDASDHRLLSTIAYAYGFASHSHFCRSFNAEFGCTPMEARQLGLPGYLPLESAPANFTQWLMQVRD